MPEMSILRKTDTSLYLYLKDIVLRSFVEKEEYVSLEAMAAMSSPGSYVYEAATDMEPDPTGPGRGWVYFDTVSGTDSCGHFTSADGLNGDGDVAYGTPEQDYRVVVYEMTGGSLDVVPCDQYMIDYIDGRIVSSRELIEPYVTYYWNYVSIVDEWPAIEAADSPVIVIDIHGTDKAGYQLGGGKKVTRKVDLHIFASDPSERNDLVETLYDGLYNKSCPLYNFTTGSVLDYDGTFYGRRSVSDPLDKLTYLFDRGLVSNISTLYFDGVTSRHISLPILMSQSMNKVTLSDLNSYRSKVSFSIISYDDRII